MSNGTDELPGQNENAAIGVDNLRVPIGFLQIGAESDRAVIGKNDRVALLHDGTMVSANFCVPGAS